MQQDTHGNNNMKVASILNLIRLDILKEILITGAESFNVPNNSWKDNWNVAIILDNLETIYLEASNKFEAIHFYYKILHVERVTL